MKNRAFINQSDAGFTILEVIAVVVIIGVLGAMAAPGWLAFMNRQRASAVKEELQQAIRTAQSEAKQRRRSLSIEFHPSDEIDEEIPAYTLNGFQQILGQGEISAGAIELVAIDANDDDVSQLVFRSDGSLAVEDSDYDAPNRAPSLPVTISIESPAGSNSKTCLMIESLLGSIDSGSGAECN
jgi:prepilin-type N-terminal cleavage/methylation domain-containing protein